MGGVMVVEVDSKVMAVEDGRWSQDGRCRLEGEAQQVRNIRNFGVTVLAHRDFHNNNNNNNNHLQTCFKAVSKSCLARLQVCVSEALDNGP